MTTYIVYDPMTKQTYESTENGMWRTLINPSNNKTSIPKLMAMPTFRGAVTIDEDIMFIQKKNSLMKVRLPN